MLPRYPARKQFMVYNLLVVYLEIMKYNEH